MHHELAFIDQSPLHQRQRKLYTSDQQSPARLPLEPLDIRFQIPGTSSPKQIVSRSGKLAAE